MELDANKVIAKLWDKIKALTFQVMVLEEEIERLKKELNKE